MSSANVDKIASMVSDLTVVEVCDLVKLLEEKFGVSAQAAAVAVAPGAAAGSEAQAQEEQTEFEVVLKSFKDKIRVKSLLIFTCYKSRVQEKPWN